MPTVDRVEVFEGGLGVIEPTDKYTDEQRVEAVDGAQKEIEDPHVVCIDARKDLEGQPVRVKMSGGNTMTGFAATLYGKWRHAKDVLDEAGPVGLYKKTAQHLLGAGSRLGGHIDNHADRDQGRSGCGAADNFVAITEVSGKKGGSDEFKEQARKDMGELFDNALWDGVVAGAAEATADERIHEWNGFIMADTVKEHGVLEVLNGDHTHQDKDPENKRHNHWEEAVNVNHHPGKSNDRDNQDMPFFQVDVPAIVEEVERLAGDHDEFKRLMHGAVLYQYATAYVLCKDLPVIRT